jgi:hypothetical protein
MAKLKAKEIHGHPFTYLVTSSDGSAEPHVFDALANEGNGRCTCMDFSCKCQPNIDKQTERLGGRFIRVDYLRHQQVKAVLPDGKKKLIVHSFPNPERTRCKHSIPVLKRIIDPLLKEISNQQNHGKED